ncbi:MAG: ribonuclease P protein component [Chlamydiota bacterium]
MTQPITYRFPKSIRLLQRKQFRKLGNGCDRRLGKLIVINLKKNFLLHTRLGITVTKKYGKAHDRNRFKRTAREAFRLCRHRLIEGYDIVIRPRSKTCGASTPEIIEELVQLIGEKRDCPGKLPRIERS